MGDKNSESNQIRPQSYMIVYWENNKKQLHMKKKNYSVFDYHTKYVNYYYKYLNWTNVPFLNG